MYALVLLMYETKNLDKVFTYKIPSFLHGKIKIGTKVIIPFNNKYINGIVLEIKKECNETFDIKEIKEIINDDISFDEEMINLAYRLKELTLCSLSTAFKTMVPNRLKVSNNKKSLAKYDYIINLNDKNVVKEFIKNNKRSKKQNELLELLLQDKDILAKDYPSYIIKALQEKDLISLTPVAKYRLDAISNTNNDIKLSSDQQKVVFDISKVLNEYKIHLIHGVTASGKTEVYFSLIEKVLKKGKTALVLVPEITLSTQLIKRFYNRFGNIVGIYHSSLADGEKYDEYLKAYRGDVKIVVGTRSSVFTPLKNLGIIIVDEEHSDNFKQDTNPRYNAIDIAKYRAKYHRIPLVLGSATPLLESMAKSLKGIYTLHNMPNRIGNSILPEIKIVDMGLEVKKHNPIISSELLKAITNSLANNTQCILLLNRRGYSPFITCHNCGYTYKCKYCDITLTYHKSTNSLRCHYCGYTVLKDEKCPECKEKSLSYLGIGTEKLEEELLKKLPSARIIRMDADTTSKKGAHEKIINDFKDHKYDILIGTQMISKGLDFPLVTTVGVLNADASLNIPDFRSSERTFSLLSQVAGRAGRSEKKGLVVIQTFNPDNYLFENISNHDYEGFYNNEIKIRKDLKYPPYYFITSLKIISKDYEKASKMALKTKKYLDSNLSDKFIILGPTTANVFKINNIYRFQIIIKHQKNYNLLEVLNDLDNIIKLEKNVYLEIDINPLKV